MLCGGSFDGVQDVNEEAGRDRRHVELRGLREVVADERLQLLVALEISVDQVRASTRTGRSIGDPHDPVDPLAADDPLALSDGCSGRAQSVDPRPGSSAAPTAVRR